MTTSNNTTTTANNNVLLTVKSVKLVNEQDCQYGVLYTLHHIGSGNAAQVQALGEAEDLGLIPNSADRDRANTNVWNQVRIVFVEENDDLFPNEEVVGLGATAFQPSHNVSIHLPLTPALLDSVGAVARNELIDRLRYAECNKASNIEAIMWRLGVATAGGSDHLIYGGGDGHWQTLAGRLLIRHYVSYDYSDYGVEHTAGADVAPGERLIDFGGAHLQYVGLCPDAMRLPVQVAEYLHTYVCRHYDGWESELLAKRKAEALAWGQARNAELAAFGLSKAEKSAWWSLYWKREWDAQRWAEFCGRYTAEQLASAMAAQSTAYLQAVGIQMEGSFPRTMDAIEALGKALGLKKQYVKDWRRIDSSTLVAPTKVTKEGRTWSF